MFICLHLQAEAPKPRLRTFSLRQSKGTGSTAVASASTFSALMGWSMPAVPSSCRLDDDLFCVTCIVCFFVFVFSLSLSLCLFCLFVLLVLCFALFNLLGRRKGKRAKLLGPCAWKISARATPNWPHLAPFEACSTLYPCADFPKQKVKAKAKGKASAKTSASRFLYPQLVLVLPVHIKLLPSLKPVTKPRRALSKESLGLPTPSLPTKPRTSKHECRLHCQRKLVVNNPIFALPQNDPQNVWTLRPSVFRHL